MGKLESYSDPKQMASLNIVSISACKPFGSSKSCCTDFHHDDFYYDCITRNWMDENKKTHVISNSGPVRYVAPISRASMIDCNIREWFPSKSSAHWLSVDTATVTFRPIFVVQSIFNLFRAENWKKKRQINYDRIKARKSMFQFFF